jgi:hypothetical protein
MIFCAAILLTPAFSEASDPSLNRSEKNPPASAPSKAQGVSMTVEERWEKVQNTVRPDLVVAMCEAFTKDFPNSRYSRAEAILVAGASKSLAATRSAQLSLDAIDDTSGDSAYRNMLTSAMRGDGDAAYRIAGMYRHGANGLAHDLRRYEQWLNVAGALGRGDASWQLAEIYNRKGLVAEAARLEAMARGMGYRAPERLPSKAQNF